MVPAIISENNWEGILVNVPEVWFIQFGDIVWLYES